VAGAFRVSATVKSIERFDQDVATFEFAYEGRRLRFRPGQFVHLAVDPFDHSQHWPDSRIFSIASGPAAADVRLTISRQGAYTSRILDELRIGSVVWLKGPYGDFVVESRDSNDHIVLIAGGTGITPFCAAMENWLQHPELCKSPVSLYYGARSSSLLIYRELATRCSAVIPGFACRYFSETGGVDVVKQRLDIDTIVRDGLDVGKCHFYLSGPKAMIDSFASTLRQAYSVPLSRILIDAWE
jgi:ferredoxin-NADP reductase